MEISIKESTMVRPAEETPKGSLWVSNMDLVMGRYHVPTVYFFKPNASSNFFDAKVLKEALSKILVPFYFTAGRLGYDENGRLEINCNAEGVLLVEAESSSVMDNLIGDFTDKSEVWRLVPKIDYSAGVSSYPLIVLQVTTFKCGGVTIGTGIQHTLADGMSALHFINSWADMARGLPLSIAPFNDRTLLRARGPPTPTFHHVEYDPIPSINNSTDQSGQKPSIVSVFKLTVEQINALKAKPQEDGKDTRYSTYNILAAHIWRCVSKARCLSNDQETKLYIPVDGRVRLDPPLPPAYFGNAIFETVAVVRVGDLISEPFIETINRIQKLIKKMDNEYLRSAIDFIEIAPNVDALARGPQHFRCPNLGLVSWMLLPVHDANFGWGLPVYMRPANVVQEGKMYILRSPNNDGSLSVVTRLEAPHMKLFEEFLYDF